MAVQQFSYKGRNVSIDEQDGKATVTVDNKVQFACHLHTGNISLWSCHTVYFCTPDLRELAKHLVDNVDLLTSPDTAPQEGMTLIGAGGSTGHQHDPGGRPGRK